MLRCNFSHTGDDSLLFQIENFMVLVQSNLSAEIFMTQFRSKLLTFGAATFINDSAIICNGTH